MDSKHTDLVQQINQYVAKGNDLITSMLSRDKRNLEGTTELKLVLYLISKIKPNDDPITEYTVSVADFNAVRGNIPANYTALKKISDSIFGRYFSLKNFNGKGTETKYTWFSKAVYNKGEGTISFTFNPFIAPFLFALKKHYTSYPLQYVLPMRSQYSIRLYELLKCEKSRQPKQNYFSFYLDDLKKTLKAENYARWIHFRQKVLEPAIGDLNSKKLDGEVNFYSDLKVSYRGEKRGRAYYAVVFRVEYKTKDELAVIHDENEKLILRETIRPKNYKELELPGQTVMENLLVEDEEVES